MKSRVCASFPPNRSFISLAECRPKRTFEKNECVKIYIYIHIPTCVIFSCEQYVIYIYIYELKT